ncbi:hypothetical protein NMG60_11031690 [Bertholletia excelsa]
MGKLGKKARKFAKKNLQSVLRRKRKTNALFKKKSSSRDQQDTVDDGAGKTVVILNGRNHNGEEIEDISLNEVFSEDDSDGAEDLSDSDGFLSEDWSSQHMVESQNEINLEDNSSVMDLLEHCSKVAEELAVQNKRLDRLKNKDPGFAKFLAEHEKSLEKLLCKEMDSDEDETDNHSLQRVDEDTSLMNKGNILANSVINSWSQLVKKEYDKAALTSLLNVYRAACHYGTESIGIADTAPSRKIQSSETFCDILIFMLREADNIFQEVLQELKNTSKWKNFKPLIRSYLRSTLFLLNQVTDSEILAFTLTRLRASIIFFAAFPSLLKRLIKVAVHLWATGEGVLSSCSFLIIRDVAVVFGTDCFDICLIKMYKAYIGHSNVVTFINSQRMQFLRNSLVEICSLDVHKSCAKALVSIEQLARILKHGLRTKKKEALKKICGWQYVNCIDLWVMFISANLHDYDLHHVFYVVIQLINGLACLFPGPRYLPLRLKCIQWLNHLSSSSGIFIPVASFILDALEYKIKEHGQPENLPKHWLKFQNFQEECVISTVGLLSEHFAQWSYHIAFPELASIPLICLRKFHETTTSESLKRMVKRLIDQVEQNINFVRKKRDEVAFSPKDHQSIESFLQIERRSLNAPFTQYYRSVKQKAASRNFDAIGTKSLDFYSSSSLEQSARTVRKSEPPCAVNHPSSLTRVTTRAYPFSTALSSAGVASLFLARPTVCTLSNCSLFIGDAFFVSSRQSLLGRYLSPVINEFTKGLTGCLCSPTTPSLSLIDEVNLVGTQRVLRR